MNFSWNWLERFDALVGIILAVPVFWSWCILLGSRRRQKPLIKNLEVATGDRPVAVSIDLIPGESENQAIAFLKKTQSRYGAFKDYERKA